MNSEQNTSVNSPGQKKASPKSYGTRRFASQIEAFEEEASSSVCCLSDVRNKDTRRRNDGSKNILKNIVENNLVKPETLVADLNDKTEYPLTRDEIVSRRKLKVAARKKMKKTKNIQKDDKVTVELVERPVLSLPLTSEDFPALNEHKIKKRIYTSVRETLTTNVENIPAVKSSVVSETKDSKTVEKSWKPKVKDPINIDLSQALVSKNEKHKMGLKKIDPSAQRNLVSGNILDSDNPTRKKGKVRPDKVQKPSKLKSRILNERRKKLSENKESNPVMSNYSLPETIESDNNIPCSLVEKADEHALPTESDITDSAMTVNEMKLTELNPKGICSIITANIHSRRFREYCTNCLTEEIITNVCALLEKIAYFQDRMYAREPIKASAKRRYVAGINQVSKYLQVRKVKLLVIAPDLEKNPGEGGLDEIVQNFKIEAESQEIPCVFGPNRKRLGKSVKKNTLVSCVAVLSYEGAEEQYAQVLEALHEGKKKYWKLTGSYEEDLKKDIQDINLKPEESFVSASDVTSSLLAALREEVPPTERLLRAIQQSGDMVEE